MEGGRGRGFSPGLGRKTFLDELIAMVNYSTGDQNQGPSFVIRSLVSPRMEASVSTVKRSVGAVTPSGVLVEGNPRDRGSSMGLGGPKEVYGINGEEVTKE